MALQGGSKLLPARGNSLVSIKLRPFQTTKGQGIKDFSNADDYKDEYWEIAQTLQ